MDAIQLRCFELLNEIDKICEENGLMYCLSPQTAARAVMYGNLEATSNELDVCMPVDDAVKFIDIIEKSNNKSRFVECMKNSKKYSAFCADYVNEDTTYIEVKQGDSYSHFGIGVTIHFIKTGKADKLTSMLETGWENNGYRLFRKLDKNNILAFGLVRAMMIMGRKALSKMIFNKLVAAYGGPIKGKKTFIKELKKDNRYFKKGTFDKLTKIKLGSGEYPVPEDTETYITDFFGPGWRELVINSPGKRNAIQMADVPYREYLAYLDRCGRSLKAVFHEQRMAMLSGVFAFRHFNAWKKAWDVARRSGDRLAFYEEFQLKKERIDNLYANKEYEELDEIFAEHEKQVRYYANNNLGLCVSEEIMEIQCELLKNRGEKALAERLRKLAPEEHKKPLTH